MKKFVAHALASTGILATLFASLAAYGQQAYDHNSVADISLPAEKMPRIHTSVIGYGDYGDEQELKRSSYTRAQEECLYKQEREFQTALNSNPMVPKLLLQYQVHRIEIRMTDASSEMAPAWPVSYGATDTGNNLLTISGLVLQGGMDDRPRCLVTSAARITKVLLDPYNRSLKRKIEDSVTDTLNQAIQQEMNSLAPRAYEARINENTDSQKSDPATSRGDDALSSAASVGK